MTAFERLHTPDNRNYQEQLAASLVECMGPEGAARACQANGWDGVLCHVLPRPGHAAMDTGATNRPSISDDRGKRRGA